jgi:hypothetical protein
MTQKPSNKQSEALENERQLYKTVFNTPSGQKLIKRLEYLGYYNRTTFVQGNNEGTLINEGKRYIVLHIKNMLDDDRMENIKQDIIKKETGK